MFAPVVATALLLSPAVMSTAYAAEDDDEFTESEDDGGRKKKKKVSAENSAGAVREISRGFYAKANVGAASYFGTLASTVNAGTFVGLSIGGDFVDNERQSMSWEVGLTQGLHNGMDYVNQAALGCVTLGTGAAACTEGDLRTYALQATYEFSFYPTRRVGLGFRAGGGVLYSPLLINSVPYTDKVLAEYGGDPGWHNSPKPIVLAGPTFEYYTKLSHFSVGIDVDIVYGIGWDIGLNGSGALKYTF